jgi:hypothetical protein
MKNLALVLTFAAVAGLATVATPRGAYAEIGTADEVPAATLLLPYFEVDLGNPAGVDTTFTINNASATAILAHVTLWTDEAIPTLNFNVYLTGYDQEEIDLRDLFAAGTVPATASAGQDQNDTISPKGGKSQDINFASCTGILPLGPLDATTLAHIRRSHTGRRSSLLNGCVGAAYGDQIARGYVTVDTVNNCTNRNPSDPNYLTSDITFQNVMWGDYNFRDDANGRSSGHSLVHIEACNGPAGSPPFQGYVGNGAGLCPLASGDYTFYGRSNGFTATDQREPLDTSFAARFVNGGAFNGTDLLVWRDPKAPFTGHNLRHGCINKNAAWFPLLQNDAVAFDETENPSDLCFLRDNVPPVIGGTQRCFPLAAQRVPTATGNPIGDPLDVPYTFGWLYLNLNHTLKSGEPQMGIAQSWVETAQSAAGRFSVGYHAIPLNNASNPTNVIFFN